MKKIRSKDYLIDYLEHYNITNKDFASRIDITPKHLSSILSGDSDLSSDVIQKISFVTNISSEYINKIESSFKLELKIEDYIRENNISLVDFLNKFNYKDIIKNKYIYLHDPNDNSEVAKDILKFLRVSSPQKIYEIEKDNFYKSKNSKPEVLLLWLEKCYRETINQKVGVYKKENIKILVDYIIDCALEENFDEKKLIEKFNQNGIFLVIKDDLPGGKIRGAFKVLRNKPAIYLTKKHKRIADIYFALIHELTHVKRYINKAKASSIISLEEERDKEALNYMVDNEYYEKIKKDRNYMIENERIFPKSFIVYRLALDGIIKYSSQEYQNYNKLIETIDYQEYQK